jgi:hypothetical protein
MTKSYPHTKEHNKKVSEALIGRTFSDEHRRNISKALSGRIRPKKNKAEQRNDDQK